MLSSKPNNSPRYITYPLNVPVAELEAFIYAGYAYAVDADKQVAVLTSPFADEDVKH